MQRSQAKNPVFGCSGFNKISFSIKALLLGTALVSCAGNPTAQPELAVPLPVAESSLAPIDKELHESALSAPADKADSSTVAKNSPESKSTKPDSKSKAADQPTKSSWKKSKDAQQVAEDAEAASKQPPTAKAVDLQEEVAAGPKAEMSITRVEATEAEAKGIGEIAGPATMVKIQLANNGDGELDLNFAQLRLFYGDEREPAALLTDSRSAALPPVLGAGKSTSATFIFSASNTSSTDVTLEFETGATKEIQQLVGEVSP